MMVQQSEAWSEFLRKVYDDDEFIRINGLPIFIRRGKYGTVANCQPGYASYSPPFDDITPVFEALKGMNVDLFTISTVPLSLSEHFSMKELIEFNWIVTNPVQYIDLREPLNYRKDVKRKLKKMTKNFEIKFDNSYFKDWYDIHLSRSSEQGSRPLLYDFLSSVIEIKNAYLCSVFYRDVLIGGSIFLKNNYHVDYFRSAFDSKFFYLEGNTYLLNEEIMTAREQGIKFFNMQSSVKVNDGTWNFKAGFGCKETEQYYVTKKIGSIKNILSTPIKELRNEYEGFFVLPFKTHKSLGGW